MDKDNYMIIPVPLTSYISNDNDDDPLKRIIDLVKLHDNDPPICANVDSDQLLNTQPVAHSQLVSVENQEVQVQSTSRVSSPVLVEMTSNNVPDADTPSSRTKNSTKRQHIRMTTVMKEYILKCEWNLCQMTIQKMEKFLIHVAGHVATVDDPSTSEGYICLWRNCGFATHSKSELDRHIYFHAFHAKIKAIGEVFLQEYGIQCTMDDQSRNMIPEIPEPFECMWDGCKFTFISAQDFYWHVQAHVVSFKKVMREKWLHCRWKSCNFKFRCSTRLKEHVRSHSQEKIVGCPNCGTIFAGVTKMRDHCFRHVSEELQTYECSHCKCKFATERLLKEHVRRHVNHFKCPHCEMTCTTKATIQAHIKYRHTNNKPFKCPECSKRFKFQFDIIKHLPTHSAEPSYVCFYPGCEYSCRSYTAYCCHVKKVHEGLPKNLYACHMCELKFPIGFKLTIHLKRVHNYHWPAGHTRFRYSKDEEGYYRLQTTRFESMELAQEILNDSGDDPNPIDTDLDTEERNNKETNAAAAASASASESSAPKEESKPADEKVAETEQRRKRGTKRKKKLRI